VTCGGNGKGKGWEGEDERDGQRKSCFNSNNTGYKYMKEGKAKIVR
jgi:hypothetical protein